MSGLDRAIAAAREALDASYSGAIYRAALRDLLAALDAARGGAVASVQTITSLAGETRKCIIGAAEVIDSLPVGTAVFAAPPAASDALAELDHARSRIDELTTQLDHARRRIGELTIQLGEAMKPAAMAVPAGGAYFAGLDHTGRPIYRQAEQAPPAAAVPDREQVARAIQDAHGPMHAEFAMAVADAAIAAMGETP